MPLPEVGMELEVSRGDVIIDCGANVGDLTSRFARTGATVYAFEPHPAAFSVLRKRFLLSSRVRCLEKAVTSEPSSLTLWVPHAYGKWDALDTTVAATVLGGHLQLSDEQIYSVDVESIDLAAFIENLGGRVRLVKMDIEGAEIAVLNRLIDSKAIESIDHIVVETHEKQMPELLEPTHALRAKIEANGLGQKINLGWP